MQLSTEGKDALEKHIAVASSCSSNEVGEEILELREEDKQKVYLLQVFIESLTGKKFKFILPKKIKLCNSGENTKSALQKPANQPVQVQEHQGWGLEYDLHETHYEKQTMSFYAKGSVKTSDGLEINIDLSLNMSREFASSLNVSFRAGDAVKVDPLVINFGSLSTVLTKNKFNFDIDADGTEDQISFPTNGGGFLALDINGDGIINNGLKLFGPQSGNGFNELAKYDDDKNGWIDENDDIYSKLRIWTKDDNGNDQLLALGVKSIGAIYLGSSASAFDLKTASNETLGSIARSGVYLRENGTAGVIQHVDL